MRILLTGLGLVLLLTTSWYGFLVWENNRDVPPPSREAIDTALELSIQWLEHEQDRLLQQTNPMLWWMVQQSAERTQDKRLVELFGRYRTEVLERNPNSPWRYLFDVHTWLPLQPENMQHYPDYNFHFLYGLSCAPELAAMPSVQAQLQTDFCPRQHPVSPACTTHQLMGMRFMQARGCGDPVAVAQVIHQLQERIVTQLTWDPRPVDVYLQRVLMLVESGERQRVKPVWLQQILDAQAADGGWSDQYPLLSLGDGGTFGFGPRVFTLEPPRSSFHTTAQGTLLLSLLKTGGYP